MRKWTPSRRVALAVALVVLLSMLAVASTAFAAITPYEAETTLPPALVYTGTWQPSALAGHSGGFVQYTNDGTAPIGEATFTFTGTGVKYLAAKWYNRGIASVQLDNLPPVDRDLFSPDPLKSTANVLFQQEVFSAQGLLPGVHTLKVSYTGRFNPLADPVSGYLITIDRFDVTTPDPEPPIVSSSASSTWSVVLAALVAFGGLGFLASGRREAGQ